MAQSPPPVTIGAVIRHGRIFDPKNRDNSGVDELPGNVTEILDLLEAGEIPYAIAGAIAVLSYVEGRNTQDLDLVLHSADLARIPGLEALERNADFARCRFGALQVDALLTSNRLFAHVLERHRVRRTFVEREAWCVDLEGLVMLKLYALPSLHRQGLLRRVQQYEDDLGGLVLVLNVDLQKAADRLAPYLLATDVIALKEIAREIEDRVRVLREQKFQ